MRPWLLGPWLWAALFVPAVMGARISLSQFVRINTGGVDGDSGISEPVGAMVAEALLEWARGCHLVLIRAAESPISGHVMRLWGGAVVVDVGARAFSRRGQEDVAGNLWGEAAFTCRSLLLDLTGNATQIFGFLKTSGVSLYPGMRTVLVGPQHQMADALQHPSLRNAIHAIYLALKDGVSKGVFVYRRCLYCDGGEMGVRLLDQWQLKSDPSRFPNPFSEEIGDFMGHNFRIVARFYFPTIDYTRDTDVNGTTVTLRDSLNARMLVTIAAKLNFTYVIREPKDREWGALLEGGNWTGLVGTLQQEEADFSMTITPTAPRLLAMDQARIYTRDPFVIVSMKPRRLPHFLALVTPFTGTVWLILAISVFATGVSLFVLLRAWSRLSGKPVFSLSTALFFSWGTVLEDPPTDPPQSSTGRVVVICLAILSVVAGSGYRSSLAAHLTVQLKEAEVNTFRDLTARRGWRWGSELLLGASRSYFELSTDPVVQEVFRRMETHELDENMELVLQGGYSFITTKFQNTAVVALQYTHARGYSPIHTSRVEYPKFAGTSWGFRRGAPFRRQIARAMQQQIEAGLIDYWLEDVVKERVIEERNDTNQVQKSAVWDYTPDDGNDRVPLTVSHLQGGFYLLFLGHFIALIVFVGEKCCPIRRDENAG
ncbi:glutamate receptor U1 isoform X2 [Penaeus vannamei]|uniref:glutamate receptor U1 isoform X2 n=1 Tax=Penaeus vannamei TaxID=6689 RepID=UPI00387F9DCE